jgi:superfamily II DNA/RNA helicase
LPTSSRAGGPSRSRDRRRSRVAVPALHAPAGGRQSPDPAGAVADTPLPTAFSPLGVPAPLVDALASAGCTTPLPIQAAAIPTALSGRDVLGRARTGSGKTIAFAVPTVLALAASARDRRPGAPRALVLVPTRELADQVARTVAPLARAMRLRTTTVYGGVPQGHQVAALRQGVDVLVATPGRLEDLIAQRLCSLAAVEVAVLDEADHLADLGFLPAVRRLLDQTPAGGQRLLFSATLDGAVDGLVTRYLHEPVVHSVDTVASSPPELEHYSFTVAPGDKAAVVRELASGQERSLLFTRTKHAAKKLAVDLIRHGIPAVDLHGNLSQARRTQNLAAFAGGTARVLVATDIAARGIHVDDVALVVHVDPPAEHKAYLHRSGRTARAGARGAVVTLVLPHQAREVASMIRQAGIRPTPAQIAPGAAETVALTGPPAAPVAMALAAAAAPVTRATPAAPRVARGTQAARRRRRRP